MRVFACCAHQWHVSTRFVLLSAGILCRLYTAPPVTEETFPYEEMAEADLVYLSLHGIVKQQYLYGDGLVTAFSAKRMLKLLKRPIIVLEGCEARNTPIPDTFLNRGARVVLADADESIGRKYTPGPSGKLGSDFVRMLKKGRSADDALKFAKVGKKETGYALVGDGKAKLLWRRE